jgi:hypothetical protein
MQKVTEKIETSLKNIESQPEDSVLFQTFERGPAQFGVAKRIGPEDEKHTDQTVSESFEISELVLSPTTQIRPI